MPAHINFNKITTSVFTLLNEVVDFPVNLHEEFTERLKELYYSKCTAITKKGEQCKKTSILSNRCYVHLEKIEKLSLNSNNSKCQKDKPSKPTKSKKRSASPCEIFLETKIVSHEKTSTSLQTPLGGLKSISNKKVPSKSSLGGMKSIGSKDIPSNTSKNDLNKIDEHNTERKALQRLDKSIKRCDHYISHERFSYAAKEYNDIKHIVANLLADFDKRLYEQLDKMILEWNDKYQNVITGITTLDVHKYNVMHS